MEEDYRDLVNIAVIRVPSYYTERILAQKSEAQTTLQAILLMPFLLSLQVIIQLLF